MQLGTSFIVDVTKIGYELGAGLNAERCTYISVFRAGRESVQFFILNVRDREKSLQI